jgi:hypothetical protein
MAFRISNCRIRSPPPKRNLRELVFTLTEKFLLHPAKYQKTGIKIYFINMDKDIERRKKTEDDFSLIGDDIKRVQGINGANIHYEQLKSTNKSTTAKKNPIK